MPQGELWLPQTMPPLEAGPHSIQTPLQRKGPIVFTEVTTPGYPCHSCLAVKACFGIRAPEYAQLCLRLPRNVNVLKEIKDDGNKMTVLVMPVVWRQLEKIWEGITKKGRKKQMMF